MAALAPTILAPTGINTLRPINASVLPLRKVPHRFVIIFLPSIGLYINYLLWPRPSTPLTGYETLGCAQEPIVAASPLRGGLDHQLHPSPSVTFPEKFSRPTPCVSVLDARSPPLEYLEIYQKISDPPEAVNRLLSRNNYLITECLWFNGVIPFGTTLFCLVNDVRER